MKAADRCKAHRQGDRCRLTAGHDGEWHEGQHTKFTADGKFTPNVVVISPSKLKAYSRIMRKQAKFLEIMGFRPSTKGPVTPIPDVVK